MIFRYYSNRYRRYSEILPFQITKLAANHAGGSRVYPSSGLYSWQLAETLRLQKFSPVVYSRKQFPEIFDHLLYTYIESGLPLILTLPKHVVVAFGHKSDYAAVWPHAPTEATPGPVVPHQRFDYSSLFNRAFVINDDNFFPYQILNREGPGRLVDSQYNWRQIEEFIVPLPERVFLTAEQVQPAIEAVLTDAGVGISARSPTLSGKKLLLRLFLSTARSFKRKLRERGMGHSTVENVYRRMPMPHFVWVCEIAEFSE